MYLIIFGQLLFGLIWLSNDILIAKKSMNWPSIKGEVISAEIYVHTQSVGGSEGMNNDFGPKETRTTYYKPIIIYSYEVNGRKYENDDIYIGGDDESTKRKDAEICIAERPVGTVVEVFYDPHDPQTASLVTGITEDIYLGIFIIIGFTGFAFVIFKVLNKKGRLS